MIRQSLLDSPTSHGMDMCSFQGIYVGVLRSRYNTHITQGDPCPEGELCHRDSQQQVDCWNHVGGATSASLVLLDVSHTVGCGLLARNLPHCRCKVHQARGL